MGQPSAIYSDLQVAFTDLLAAYPSDIEFEILDTTNLTKPGKGSFYELICPTADLYCDSEKCNGVRSFEVEENPWLESKQAKWNFVCIKYFCRNCKITYKVYGLRVLRIVEQKNNRIVSEKLKIHKFGEWPAFFPKVSTNVISFLGCDKHLFQKGQKAESLGLGIGALSYYRLVLEKQKNNIIDKILEIAKITEIDKKNSIDRLLVSKSKTTFCQSVDYIKNVIPKCLTINNHNPLVLMRNVLSKEIHKKPDFECLFIAKDIRVLLSEFIEQLLKTVNNKAHVNKAIDELVQFQEHD